MTEKKLIFRNENEIRLIDTDSLLAVTVANYLCSFHIENEKVFICTKTLKEIAPQPPDYFVKINRSCIVNTKKLKSINTKQKSVILSPELSFKFSTRNLKVLEQSLGLKR